MGVNRVRWCELYVRIYNRLRRTDELAVFTDGVCDRVAINMIKNDLGHLMSDMPSRRASTVARSQGLALHFL
jgi:hypothetical protein